MNNVLIRHNMEQVVDFKKIILLILLGNYGISHAYLPEHLEQYEQTNNCKNCDLTQMEFISNQHNNSELSGAFLVKIHPENLIANYSNFMSANLVYAGISRGEFKYSNFNNAKLNYAIVSNASFLGSSFSRAVFDNAKLTHNNFYTVDFINASFKNADLSYSNLMNSNITEAQLKQASSYRCAIFPDGSVFDNNGEDSCL